MTQSLDDALDLSARARRSEATEADLKRLKLALGSSVTLQVAHRVGTDFDAALSVRATDADLLDDIVAGALSRTQATKERRSARPLLTVGLAAAASLLVSAGAFGWWQARTPVAAGSPSLLPPTHAAAPALAPSSPAGPNAVPESEPLRAQSPPALAPPADNEASATPPSAQALFAKANRARSSQRAQEAIRLYRLLHRSYPTSAEALTSRVALGRLLLAEGEHAGALAEFDRQVAAGGALAEEALVWRARTRQKLGDFAAEQRDFRLLLERYPNTAYEQEARSRLGQ